jgi:hypothetical protein
MLNSEESNQLLFSFSLELRTVHTFVCTRPSNVQCRDKVNRLTTFQKPAVVAKGKSEKVNVSMFSP